MLAPTAAQPLPHAAQPWQSAGASVQAALLLLVAANLEVLAALQGTGRWEGCKLGMDAPCLDAAPNF